MSIPCEFITTTHCYEKHMFGLSLFVDWKEEEEEEEGRVNYLISIPFPLLPFDCLCTREEKEAKGMHNLVN